MYTFPACPKRFLSWFIVKRMFLDFITFFSGFASRRITFIFPRLRIAAYKWLARDVTSHADIPQYHISGARRWRHIAVTEYNRSINHYFNVYMSIVTNYNSYIPLLLKLVNNTANFILLLQRQELLSQIVVSVSTINKSRIRLIVRQWNVTLCLFVVS